MALVEVDGRVYLDQFEAGKRLARIEVVGMREGARLVRFATAQWDVGLGGIDVHFVNVDSARVIERGFQTAHERPRLRRVSSTYPAQVAVGDQSSLQCAAGQLGALLVLRQVADSELREQCAHVRTSHPGLTG